MNVYTRSEKRKRELAQKHAEQSVAKDEEPLTSKQSTSTGHVEIKQEIAENSPRATNASHEVITNIEIKREEEETPEIPDLESQEQQQRHVITAVQKRMQQQRQQQKDLQQRQQRQQLKQIEERKQRQQQEFTQRQHQRHIYHALQKRHQVPQQEVPQQQVPQQQVPQQEVPQQKVPKQQVPQQKVPQQQVPQQYVPQQVPQQHVPQQREVQQLQVPQLQIPHHQRQVLNVAQPYSQQQVAPAVPVQPGEISSPQVVYYLRRSNASVRPSDHFDATGALVASKLRRLDNIQRIRAEMLIHNILYKAEMKRL